MTLDEFAALKPGDTIENPMSGSKGVVADVTAGRVKVAWGGTVQFAYGVDTTAWMHWSKANELDVPAEPQNVESNTATESDAQSPADAGAEAPRSNARHVGA